jgi:hypothetical protein
MTVSEVLLVAWVIVTCALVALLVFRARLMSQEGAWIDLNAEDEQRTAQTVAMVERKTEKLRWPIRGLGALSAVLLVVMIGVWVS